MFIEIFVFILDKSILIVLWIQLVIVEFLCFFCSCEMIKFVKDMELRIFLNVQFFVEIIVDDRVKDNDSVVFKELNFDG